jgi:DNA-binding MurR/RpiR family transcriptional regulator
VAYAGRPMDVAGRITEWGPALTPAERRVADVVLQRPQLVAFGTVAELANEAGSGAATVVRLAGKLGYDGFTALQDAVQAELAHRLRPAAERIRHPVAPDVIGRTMATELDNVQSTLEAVDREAFAQAVGALSQRGATVLVLSGEASCGIARQAVGELALLRDGVELVIGSEVAVVRSIALLGPGDACLVVDLRRYDRWVLDAARRAGERGATLIALTDSALSPLALLADASFTVVAGSTGPFDSHVATLALLNAMVTAVADRLRSSATDRLDRIEAAWREAGALIEP